jgi:hypothetical protein
LLAVLLAQFASAQQENEPTSGTNPLQNMDRAIALLNEARQHFRLIRDYECRLFKLENVKGSLLPDSVLIMKVRNEPFSIYLRCEGPSADRGLEVCYVAPHDTMRVHPTGALSAFGFFTIDLRDSRAFEKNRHSITEAGLGNLLEATARYWDLERRLNKTLVKITDEEIGGHACTRIETIHPDRSAGPFYAYRCVLWLDKATHLPAGAEAYDLPRPGGPEGGGLLEAYRFLDLRCNIGLDDATFCR